jgi:hypothetical protein
MSGQATEFRREIASCCERGDWHGAYLWAKGWIGSGGGEHSVEPWLVYVASAIKQSQRRTAVHAVDLALENWIAEAAPRGVLLYVRGEVIRWHLRDPSTALDDLRQAEEASPDWLRSEAIAARIACEEEARSSRKRKRSVEPAPSFAGSHGPASDEVTRPPSLWASIHQVIHAEEARSRRS